MAISTNVIRAGTVTVTAGSLTVAGAGTAWLTDDADGGWFSCMGYGIPIASVSAEGTLTLDYGWTGPTGSAQPYSIWRAPSAAADVIEASSRLADMVKRLHAGSWMEPNGAGRLADRAQYDGEAEGFVFARGGDVSGVQVCIKLSDANADWSAFVSLEGIAGSQGLPGTNGTNGVGTTYDPNLHIPSKPPANIAYKTLFVRNVSFSTNFLGSLAKVSGATAAASAVFTLYKQVLPAAAVQIGTITFGIGSTTGVFAGTATNFVPGDILLINTPLVQDATLSELLITLAGSRT